MRRHAACESPLRPGELLVVGGRAPASSKKLEQDSQIEFFDDEVDVDDGTLKVRALRVDDPVPKFRILPMAGQAPPDSYGHVCVGWRADALSFEKLRRDRGEELEKHAVAIPGGAAREPCDDPVEGRNRSGEPQREPWTPRSASSLIGENWGVAGPSGVVGRRHTSPASSSSSESGGGPHAMSNRWRASGPYDESEVAPP